MAKKTKKKTAKKPRLKKDGTPWGRTGPRKGAGGRPRAEIDWTLVDDLCAIHCTHSEIAAVCHVHHDTLNIHCKRKFKMTFSEYIEEKRALGKRSLRRLMWQKAETGSNAMLIFLAKNWLGMADRNVVENVEVGPRKVVVAFPANELDGDK